MKALVSLAAASVLTATAARPAWACGQCFGDGGGSSVLGWIALGLGAFVVYRLFRRR